MCDVSALRVSRPAARRAPHPGPARPPTFRTPPSSFYGPPKATLLYSTRSFPIRVCLLLPGSLTLVSIDADASSSTLLCKHPWTRLLFSSLFLFSPHLATDGCRPPFPVPRHPAAPTPPYDPPRRPRRTHPPTADRLR